MQTNLVVVAVGVLIVDGRVLVAQRQEGVHLPSYWEFPGGKVEAGEDVEAALKREFEEELDIRISGLSPLIEIHHAYPEKQVFLRIYRIAGFQGEPRGMQGQRVIWCDNCQLETLQFPAANTAIVDLVKTALQSVEEASSR